MADSLCGPSNALQNFQKHAQVDRTLQQDRLTQRRAPGQDFRNSHGAPPGALDAEFAAFEAGFPVGAIPPELHSPPPIAPSHLIQSPPPNAQGWASDFQRLHISPGPHLRPQQPAPALQAGPSWHHEFLNHQAPAKSSPLQNHPMSSAPMFGSGLQSQGYSNTWFAEQAGSSYAGEGSQSVQGVAQFDERAFEDAFAAAQKDLDLQAKNHEELSASGIGQIIDSIGLGQEEVLASTTSNVEQATDATTKSHLDSRMESKAQWAMRNEVDQIPSRTPEMEEFQREMHEHPESEQKEKNSAADDRDALAATAGQLLESVKDDTSAKFQGSQFLALMRKLRDKEVVVEGDKMVEADTRTGNASSKQPAVSADIQSPAGGNQLPFERQSRSALADGQPRARGLSVGRLSQAKKAERRAEFGLESDIGEFERRYPWP